MLSGKPKFRQHNAEKAGCLSRLRETAWGFLSNIPFESGP